MLFENPEEYFMREAYRQAQRAFQSDEVPVGAVIVQNNEIIARAFNQVETLKDPTAHAEVIAITQACHHLSSKWLYDCDVYVTLEPCSMCAGALVLARVRRIVYAARDPKTGACGSVYDIAQSQKLNHSIKVEQGPLENESSLLLREFFAQKR